MQIRTESYYKRAVRKEKCMDVKYGINIMKNKNRLLEDKSKKSLGNRQRTMKWSEEKK